MELIDAPELVRKSSETLSIQEIENIINAVDLDSKANEK